MEFYDFVYYSSYAAALVAFSVFSFSIRYRLASGKNSWPTSSFALFSLAVSQ